MKKQTVALFDFDGTLTKGLPSRLLFIKYLVGAYGLLKALPQYLYKKFIANSDQSGDLLDLLFLVGWSKEELELQATLFVESTLIKKVRPKALKRLQFHQSQGHVCILISGGFDVYLNIFAKKYSIQYVIGSEIEFDKQNRSTGRILNGYCLGNEKVRRLQTLFPERANYIFYAYGDSHHDRPLLEYSDYGFYRRFE